MRIALVTSCFPDPVHLPTGGVSAAVATLATALKAQAPELDLHIIWAGAPQTRPPQAQPAHGWTLHRIGRTRLASWSPSGAAFRGAVHRVLSRIQADVVHVQDQASLVDARDWPSLLTVHGIQERDTWHRAQHLRGIRSALVARRERAARARFRNVVAIAAYVVQQLGSERKGRAWFVPNPVRAPFFEGASAVAPSPPVILQVGSLIPRKNAALTVEALRILQGRGIEAELRLVGPCPDRAYASKLQDMALSLGLRDRLHLTGPADVDTLVAELRGARVHALPSFQETAPIAIGEAAAMGVPTVTTPAGGSAELVSDGITGALADPRCARSLADALAPFLQSPGLAQAFGDRARVAAQRHRPAAVAQATLQVYADICSKSVPTPVSAHARRPAA